MPDTISACAIASLSVVVCDARSQWAVVSALNRPGHGWLGYAGSHVASDCCYFWLAFVS